MFSAGFQVSKLPCPLGSAVVVAQTVSGTFSGTITDQRGAAVAPGVYDFTVSAAGFSLHLWKNVAGRLCNSAGTPVRTFGRKC